MFGSKVKFSGRLSTRVIRRPKASLLWKLKNLLYMWPGIWRLLVAKLDGIQHFQGALKLRVLKADGLVIDHGLVSLRLVTTAFVNFMVAELQAETSVWGDFKFHDCGTGVTPAAIGNTAMETQFGGARVSGTQVQGASAKIYQSVATIPFTGTLAITEHGLFSIITAGTLMDRHVFSAINVENGDSIQFTYDLSVDDGG